MVNPSEVIKIITDKIRVPLLLSCMPAVNKSAENKHCKRNKKFTQDTTGVSFVVSFASKQKQLVYIAAVLFCCKTAPVNCAASM